jgi:RNA polymerase sigma-70 factor (ECF subfamily)
MPPDRTTALPDGSQLLAAARDGDEGAFARLVEPHRRELHAHCYRMLGSVHDAEDAQQDALLRAWKNLSQLKDRDSLRAWLYRIATNASLDAIARRPKRVLPMDYGPSAGTTYELGMPPAESVWIEPYPDAQVDDGFAGPDARYEQREAVELAFIAALQHLAPLQRAALILREVLGFSAKEVADTLDTTVPAVNSALQRARQAVDERLPEQSQQETLRALGDDELRTVVEAYMEAMAQGDVETVISLLTDDAAWSMPPLPAWFNGLAEIRNFLENGPLSGDWRWRHLAGSASGQAAVGTYHWDPHQERYLPFALDVFTLEGKSIKEVTSFIVRTTELDDPEDFVRYPERALDEAYSGAVFDGAGLPAYLDA